MTSQRLKTLPGLKTALAIKNYYGTVIESISARVDALASIDHSLLENDTALLESTLYLVKSLQNMQADSQRLPETLLPHLETLQQQLQSHVQQQHQLLAQQVELLTRQLERLPQQSEERHARSRQHVAAQLDAATQQQHEQFAALRGRHEELHSRYEEQRSRYEELQGQQAQQAGALLVRLEQVEAQGQLRHDALLRHLGDLLQQSVAERRQQQEALLNRLNGLEQQLETYIETHFSKSTALVETDNFELLNPEVGLVAHLYSYLPCRNALDIGANVGEVSERLLRSGYNVYAFEPFPPVYEKLMLRLGEQDNFHAQQIAIGFVDRSMELHLATDTSGNNKYRDHTQFSSLLPHSMPEDLIFTKTIQVAVRSLESLRLGGEIPEDVGLLKIDTEGYDLEVIRGMGAQQPAVVVAEFWDPALPFGKAGAFNWLESLVREMRQRDYHWHIIIYRVWGKTDISFYCNQTKSVNNSWGNVFFFQDYQIFTQALQWCAAVLPPTYFNA